MRTPAKKTRSKKNSSAQYGPDQNTLDQHSLAIIGMGGQFASAQNLDAYWGVLQHGIEAVTPLTEVMLRQAGVSDHVIQQRGYVRARAAMVSHDGFDAARFKMAPRQARLLEPQYQHLLLCIDELMQRTYGATISAPKQADDRRLGVYVSCGSLDDVPLWMPQRSQLNPIDAAFAIASLGVDVWPGRIARYLGAKGPAMAIQNACTSSLTAVCVACEQLLLQRCDVALVAASQVSSVLQRGYWGGMANRTALSGHTRSYAPDGDGVVPGDGVGALLLKRLPDAIRDGDPIFGIIRGFAMGTISVSEDGRDTQGEADLAKLIRAAHAMAGLETHTNKGTRNAAPIQWLEGQGAATEGSDALEIGALRHLGLLQHVAFSSARANVGDTGVANGMASIIKALLALQHGSIPPMPWAAAAAVDTKHAIGNGTMGGRDGVTVISKALPWQSHPSSVRRVGISGIGVRGPSAYIVLEEPKHITTANISARATYAHAPHGPSSSSSSSSSRFRSASIQSQHVRAMSARHDPVHTMAMLRDGLLAVLGADGDGHTFTEDTVLIDLGVDSFLALELRERWVQHVGEYAMPAAAALSHLSLRAVCDALQRPSPEDAPSLMAHAPNPGRAHNADQQADISESWDVQYVGAAASQTVLQNLYRDLQHIGDHDHRYLDAIAAPGKPALADWQTFSARIAAGLRIVPICRVASAQMGASKQFVAAYVIQPMRDFAIIHGDGITILPAIHKLFTVIDPAFRGQFDLPAFARSHLRHAPEFATLLRSGLYSAVGCASDVWRAHAHALAGALAERPAHMQTLLQELAQPIGGTFLADRWHALLTTPRLQQRVIANVRATHYGSMAGGELLQLSVPPQRDLFSALLPMTSLQHRVVLRETVRHAVIGDELRFVGFDLRWFEPVFQWVR